MLSETPRQKKSRKTRQRIFDSVKRIISRYGYSALTIKNICEEAQISNGSFFHYFGSKDDLMAYYLNEGFKSYLEASDLDINSEPDFSDSPVGNQIIDLYLHYADYCEKNGLDFVSDYYNTGNSALSIHASMPGKPGDIVSDRIIQLVQAAQAQGDASPSVDASLLEKDLCTITKGVIFDWCVCKGAFDLKTTLERVLRVYINQTLNSYNG